MPVNAKVSGDIHALVREVVCHHQAFDALGDGTKQTNSFTDEVHASKIWLKARAAASGTRTPMRLVFSGFLINKPSVRFTGSTPAYNQSSNAGAQNVVNYAVTPDAYGHARFQLFCRAVPH